MTRDDTVLSNRVAQYEGSGLNAALYQYATGDGNDIIIGFNDYDSLSISGNYKAYTDGVDTFVSVGSGLIRLANYSADTLNVNGAVVKVSGSGNSKLINGTENADDITNTVSGATINALGGDDTIDNYAENSIIFGGKVNDLIVNKTTTGTLYKYLTGDGNDTIQGYSAKDSLSINGNYKVYSSGDGIVVSVGSGSILLENYSANTINVNSAADIDLTEDYGLSVKTVDATKTSGGIQISGNDSDNSLKGGKGDDILRGGETVTVKGVKDNAITFIDGDSGTELIFFADVRYAPLATGLTYDAKRTALTASNKFTDTAVSLSSYLDNVKKFNASAVKQAIDIIGDDSNNLLLITDYKDEDSIQISGTISDTITDGKDIIYTIGNGALTVKNGVGKAITFV